MKIFYTEQDINDMHANGVVEIKMDDNTILTDLAREKAIEVGLHIKQIEGLCDQPKMPAVNVSHIVIAPQMPLPPYTSHDSSSQVSTSSSLPLSAYNDLDPKLISSIKSSVIAKLSNDIVNDDRLLDQIISTVLILLDSKFKSNKLMHGS